MALPININELIHGSTVEWERNWCLIKRYDKESETYIQGWVSTRYLAQIR